MAVLYVQGGVLGPHFTCSIGFEDKEARVFIKVSVLQTIAGFNGKWLRIVVICEQCVG